MAWCAGTNLQLARRRHPDCRISLSFRTYPVPPADDFKWFIRIEAGVLGCFLVIRELDFIGKFLRHPILVSLDMIELALA